MLSQNLCTNNCVKILIYNQVESRYKVNLHAIYPTLDSMNNNRKKKNNFHSKTFSTKHKNCCRFTACECNFKNQLWDYYYMLLFIISIKGNVVLLVYYFYYTKICTSSRDLATLFLSVLHYITSF